MLFINHLNLKVILSSSPDSSLSIFLRELSPTLDDSIEELSASSELERHVVIFARLEALQELDDVTMPELGENVDLEADHFLLHLRQLRFTNDLERHVPLCASPVPVGDGAAAAAF